MALPNILPNSSDSSDSPFGFGTSLVANAKIPGVSDLILRKVIAGASAAFLILKRIPTVAEIKKYSGVQERTISKVIATRTFKDTMGARGFQWQQAKLSPEQEFAVGIITDPTRKGDMNSKLRAAGVSYSQYRAWMKQPHFKDFISQVGEDMLGEHIHDVHTSVMNRATNGDINAAKLVYELTGRYDPARQQMADLQNVIGLILEVITRYVRDIPTLDLIAEDVATIMAGKTPKALGTFDISDGIPDIEDAEVIDDSAPVGFLDSVSPSKDDLEALDFLKKHNIMTDYIEGE